MISGLTILSFQFSSCSPEEVINTVTTVEVTANERMASATFDAVNKYGAGTKLVLVLGKNVKANGKTELSALTAVTDPESVGAWLYVFRVPSDTSLRVYTPNPLITATGCIELTAFFNINHLIGLIQDTSAQNLISGALDLIISSDIGITTSQSVLVDSDYSLNLASTSNPVIKFNENYVPSASNLNGNVFFSDGTNHSRNMILMPAAGTLELPNFIQDLTGFPDDLWIVQYKKTNTSNLSESLIIGTVVQQSQMMGIPGGIQSPAINLSKYVTR
jgi:hypothetical protein